MMHLSKQINPPIYSVSYFKEDFAEVFLKWLLNLFSFVPEKKSLHSINSDAAGANSCIYLKTSPSMWKKRLNHINMPYILWKSVVIFAQVKGLQKVRQLLKKY